MEEVKWSEVSSRRTLLQAYAVPGGPHTLHTLIYYSTNLTHFCVHRIHHCFALTVITQWTSCKSGPCNLQTLPWRVRSHTVSVFFLHETLLSKHTLCRMSTPSCLDMENSLLSRLQIHLYWIGHRFPSTRRCNLVSLKYLVRIAIILNIFIIHSIPALFFYSARSWM